MRIRREPATSGFRAEAVLPSRRSVLTLGCACCATAVLPGGPARAVPSAVQHHLDLARQAASDDLGAYLDLGKMALAPPVAPKIDLAPLIAQPVPPPAQAFDNLYFVGARGVSAWVVRTSDGLILIDTLNNDEEAERVIGAGMRRLGLDPADIRIVVVTHGHGDHYGGVGYIKRVAAPRVVMSDADWRMMATKLEFDAPEWGRPPQRDMTVADGGAIELGDTRLDVLETPGHTMGTLSLLLTVREGDTPHRALLWGGTSYNFGAQPDRMQRLQAYIDATMRVREIARQRGVDVFISNHSGWDGPIARMARTQSSNRNAFVVGTDTTVRSLTVMNECAKATQEAWTA